MTPDLSMTLRLVAALASAGAAISTLELLLGAREFRRGGLYDWGVIRQGFTPGRVTRWLDVPFSYPLVLSWMALRFAAALLILAGAAQGWMAPVLYFLSACTSFALSWRVPFGLEGAEQMIRIIFSALALSSLAPGNIAVQTAAVWFVALQSCLAYLVAGLAKYKVPAWRNGSFLCGILGTTSYGNRWILQAVRGAGMAQACSILVIVFECAFPLVLVAGRPWALAFLAGGVLFHGINAVVMGLNVFFWAFVATYPAIWFCTR